MREKIELLRNQGKTYSQISDELSCSKSLVCYYIGDDQKQKTLRRNQSYRNKCHPYLRKIFNFSLNSYNTRSTNHQKSKFRVLLYQKIYEFCKMTRESTCSKPSFTVDDVIDKFGENPKCYLTGENIDIYKPTSYHFDHIIPRSKGGTNSIDNLGICTKQANLSKRDMSPDEFINFCKKVLSHNGFTVKKSED